MRRALSLWVLLPLARASLPAHIFDRPVQRKCEVLAVTSGTGKSKSTRSAFDVEGAYMLEPGSFDMHFIYRRHLEEKKGGSDNGGEGQFDLADAPRFLYYSATLPGWLLGPTLGGAADWLAAARDPTRLGTSPHDARLRPWRLNGGRSRAAAPSAAVVASSNSSSTAAEQFRLGALATGLGVGCRDGAAHSPLHCSSHCHGPLLVPQVQCCKCPC